MAIPGAHSFANSECIIVPIFEQLLQHLSFFFFVKFSSLTGCFNLCFSICDLEHFFSLILLMIVLISSLENCTYFLTICQLGNGFYFYKFESALIYFGNQRKWLQRFFPPSSCFSFDFNCIFCSYKILKIYVIKIFHFVFCDQFFSYPFYDVRCCSIPYFCRLFFSFPSNFC